MSSFSSIVQKPGKKIVPKAAPRRNVPRRPTLAPDPASDISQSEETRLGRPAEQFLAPPISEIQLEEVGQPQSGNADSNDPVTSQAVELPTPSSADSTQDAAVEETTALAQETHEQSEPQRTAASEALVAASIEILPTPPSSVVPDAQPLDSTPDESVASALVLEPDTDRSTGSCRRSQDPENTDTRTLRKRKATKRREASTNPTKRRKADSGAGSDLTSPRRNVPLPTVHTPSSRQPSPSSRDQNVLPADLLRSATQRAASISQLANDIEAQTRSLQPRSEQHASNESDSAGGVDDVGTTASQSAKHSRSRRRKTAQEQAEEVIANAVGRSGISGRQRGVTPEDAETHHLEPAKVTMGELCEDNRLGKKSALEIEMQANWVEIVQRRKEDRLRALETAEKHSRKGIGHKQMLGENQPPVAALAPAMTVVNGVIVVDQASREIDRAAQLQQAAVLDLDNVREDRDYYKYVNQGTVGVKPGRVQHARWDEESNERFFKGLRMFGTDFLMIANMFPGMSRKQIKSKFIREENADKARIMECLANREPVQLDDYAQMANKETEEFHTLESIQKELDEQEKKLREEDNQRRKREGFATNGNGGEVRQDTAGDAEEGTERQTESVEPNRFEAMAREIVGAAVTPKKRQRKPNVGNKRGSKGGRRLEGGIEEVLGNIHEVAV